MTMFETYLFMKLDDISKVSGTLGGILASFGAILVLIRAVNISDGTGSIIKKWYSFLILIVGTLFCIFAVMIPSTKEAMIIYAVPKVSEYVKNSKELKAMPDNIVNTANEWITNFKPDSITLSAKEFIREFKK